MAAKTLTLAFALTGLLGIAATAHAETQWDQTHKPHAPAEDRRADHIKDQRSEVKPSERHQAERPIHTEAHAAARPMPEHAPLDDRNSPMLEK